MLDIEKLKQKVVEYHAAYMSALENAHANLGAMQAIQALIDEINSESKPDEDSSDSRD
jgi:hypothetical protein